MRLPAGADRPVRHPVGEHRRRARGDLQPRDRRAGGRGLPAAASPHALPAHHRGDADRSAAHRPALPDLAADAAEDHAGVGVSRADVLARDAQLPHARHGGGHPHPGDDAAHGAGSRRRRWACAASATTRCRGSFTSTCAISSRPGRITGGIARTAKGPSTGRSAGERVEMGAGGDDAPEEEEAAEP